MNCRQDLNIVERLPKMEKKPIELSIYSGEIGIHT
jgi:hypothetical protein